MKDVNILTNNGVNVAQSLELFGDMEMYDETLNDFLDMVNPKLEKLEQYKLASDMPNYAIEVHSLKSDARYLGFTNLADMSYQSEMKSKAGDIIFVQDNHPKIMAEAKKMIEVSQQYLGRNALGTTPVSSEPTTQVYTPTPVQFTGGNPDNPQKLQTVTTAQPSVQLGNVDPMTAALSEAVNTQIVPMTQAATQSTPETTIQFFNPNTNAPIDLGTQPKPVVNPVQPEPTVQFFGPDPMAQALESTMTQPQAVEPTNPAGPKEGTILVVDDSNLVANFVKKIFDVKYDVIIANDGAKAIEIVNDLEIRAKIKTCLLDLNMPNVDGYAVLEHFKQNGIFVKMPVAVVSGVEDMESIDKVNNYPIVDILSKPFNERDVQRVVEKCLATYF